MRPIYKSLVLESVMLAVTLSLQAEVTANGESSAQSVDASTLEGLKVKLVSPNVSGARDLIASGECVLDGEDLVINLNGASLEKGTHRLVVSAEFGTNTVVLYGLDITVPMYSTLENEPQEYEDIVTVVSTFGDGDKSGADATVYSKDGDGNAHITTPLSVGSGVATGAGAIASGNVYNGATIEASGDGAIAGGYAYGEGATIEATGDGAIASGSADNGASIQATSDGAIASGYAYEGASIQATGTGAIASGYAGGEGASIQAEGTGAIASGEADNGASIQATGTGAIASGEAYGEGASIQAEGAGAIASGYANTTNGNVSASGQASQAFGIGTQTQTDGQMVLGKCNVVDTDGDYALIVGNGTADNARSNAFAIDWNGNLVLFDSGTPVVLTPAKLAALIA